MFCQTHKTMSWGQENTRLDFLLINLKFIDFHFPGVRAFRGLNSMSVHAASSRKVKMQVGSLSSLGTITCLLSQSDTFVNSRIIKSESEDFLMHARKRCLLASHNRIMFAHRLSNFHKIIFSSGFVESFHFFSAPLKNCLNKYFICISFPLRRLSFPFSEIALVSLAHFH